MNSFEEFSVSGFKTFVSSNSIFPACVQFCAGEWFGKLLTEFPAIASWMALPFMSDVKIYLRMDKIV